MTPGGDWVRAKALNLVAGRSFLAIAISLEQVRDFARFGGQLAGIVLVVPADSPDALPDSDISTMTLRGIHSNIFDHVVRDFGSTLQRSADRVSTFLDSCDPKGDSIVISTLPVPHSLFGSRQIWAQDDRITRSLEVKSELPQLLAGVLPTIPGSTNSWPCERSAWDALVRSFSSQTLVVQDPGLTGGGSGTWIVDCWESAIERVNCALKSVRITSFVAGTPCNVSGFVAAPDRILVFPPSVQIIGEELDGCPVYAGNILGDGLFKSDEVAEIRSETRRFASHIASLGFRGAFGLDFIRTSGGDRRYHDINPRINGAIDSLSQYFAINGASPLPVLLLGHSTWSESEITKLEESFDELVQGHPSWRFFLTRLLETPWSETEPPTAGRWSIDPVGPSAIRVGPPCNLDELKENEALLLPTLSAKQTHTTGERLVLGDMLCGHSLGSSLSKLHGSLVTARLVDDFVG